MIDSVAGADDARAVVIREGARDRLAEVLEQVSKLRTDPQMEGIQLPEVVWLDHLPEAKPMTIEKA